MIRTGDTLVYIPTGEKGIYLEHVNEGEGRIVRLDSGKVVAGRYDEFEKVDDRMKTVDATNLILNETPDYKLGFVCGRDQVEKYADPSDNFMIAIIKKSELGDGKWCDGIGVNVIPDDVKYFDYIKSVIDRFQSDKIQQPFGPPVSIIDPSSLTSR